MLKACLRGKKILGSVCPISGFPVFSPAMGEETLLKGLAALLPGFLSCALPWGGLCKRLDPGSLEIAAVIVSKSGPEGGITGIQTVGGGCKLQYLVWCLFCFSYLIG